MGPITPGEIERRSFEIIESEVPEPRPYRGIEWQIVRRMIHASADFELLGLVRFHPKAVEAGIESLSRGCTVVTDTKMARYGISPGRMAELACKVECYVDKEEVIETAKSQGITRAMAAVEFASSRMNGAILVVGNAPTALIKIMELVEGGRIKPSLIVGMPVGFVNVIEAKERLMSQDHIPYITVVGRKGGSPLACAVVNQLATIALEHLRRSRGIS